MGVGRKAKDRDGMGLRGRGKKGWNGGWEEGERNDGMGRKGKERMGWRFGGR